MKNFNKKIATFALWINNRIVGNPWTFILSILFVFGIYALLPIQGYTKWNLTTGIFGNTAESSFELITGVGAVVGIALLHERHKEVRKENQNMNEKLDLIHKHLGIKK